MIQASLRGIGAALALALALQPLTASAQQAQGNGWFVPGQGHAVEHPAPRPAATGARAPQPAPMAAENPGVPGSEPGANPMAAMQFKLPPAPAIPPIPKGQTTPAAIIGILSVQDAQRLSTAYQAAVKELNGRSQQLREDAQKEDAALNRLGQAYAAERAKLSPEQRASKEKELQDRAAAARRRFSERDRIIQEAGQYAMLQINRTMEQITQQVALSRGVNIVLNRAQVLGVTADFDLTPQVVEILNKVLPTVLVPPDGVSALEMNPESSTPATSVVAKPQQKN